RLGPRRGPLLHADLQRLLLRRADEPGAAARKPAQLDPPANRRGGAGGGPPLRLVTDLAPERGRPARSSSPCRRDARSSSPCGRDARAPTTVDYSPSWVASWQLQREATAWAGVGVQSGGNSLSRWKHSTLPGKRELVPWT